jgi:spermidine synthase/MFS family permease
MAVFFLSGFAALLYQVVWQRILVIFSGADVYSSTLIVAAFMAGLGVGHLAGGYLADRFSRGAGLLLFALAELAIAAFGLASRGLYYDFLYQRLGPLALTPPLLTAILFGSLLWPTFFMGMSLPLLARAVTDRLERAAFTVGALYAFNTLGAATGALAATWWILPRVGLEVSLRVGAILNLVCAAIAVPLVLRLRTLVATDGPSPPAMQPAQPAPIEPTSGGLSFASWAAIYALSGFMALALEIAWFRLLSVMMKSTAFTFGTLLAIYLAGLGGGAFFGSLYAPRVRRPAATFFALQTAVALSAGCLLAFVTAVVRHVRSLRSYFASYEPLNVRDSIDQLRFWIVDWFGAAAEPSRVPVEFLVLYFVLPGLLILPSTFLMGSSFPVLQRVVQTNFARLGRRVGLLLVANIAGSVLGTIVVGWAALDVLGTAGTMKGLVALSTLYLLAGLALSRGGGARGDRRWSMSSVALAAVLVALGLALVGLPGTHVLWSRLHGTAREQLIVGEDATGLSVLRLEAGRGESRVTVFANGVGQSTMPYGDVHTALGMLPAFLHPGPREAVIIGLGSGDTVYGVAGRPDIGKITCVEIIRPQLEGLKELRRRYPYGGLTGLLEDPRVEHRSGDGRLFLMHAGRQFDIIEADALRPTSAYSGNLYSDAYFELVRSRLRPQGLAATWAPTGRVHNAFVRVFPYVVSVPGILVGSNDPIALDRAAIAKRLADPRVRAHYERAGIDADRMMSEYLADPAVYLPDFDRTALTDFNTDLFPKDEFDLSARQ